MTSDRSAADWAAAIRERLAAAKLPPAREAEIVDEIAQHLEERYREHRSGGMPHSDAAAAAWRELDEEGVLAQRVRAVERPALAELPPPGVHARRAWLGSLGQDVRYSLRVLRRSPGFAAAAVLTVAITTGPATAMLGIANWFFLRPLPEVVEPHRLATVNFGTPGERGGYTVSRISYAHLADLVAASPSVVGMAGWQSSDVTVDVDGAEPRPVEAEFVSANFFDVLGVPTIAGRRFLPEEDRAPGGATVTVLSERLARVLSPGTSPVDRIVRINGYPFTVVGVVPAAFPGAEIQSPVDLWLPGLASPRVSHAPPERWPYAPDRGPFYHFIARLAPGASADRAAVELETAALAMSERSPDTRKFQTVRPMLHAGAGMSPARLDEARLVVGSLLATGLLLALLGTANLANLFVFRTLRRGHETLIRRALGASAARLSRLLAVETVMIALGGGLLGVGFAIGTRSMLRNFAASGIGTLDIPIDWRLIAMAIGLSLLIGLLLAIPAARLTTGAELNAVSGQSARVAGRVGRRWRSGLATLQVTLSLALLISALLFVSTLRNLRGVDAGFDPHGVTRAGFGFRMRGYTPERVFQFLTEVSARLRQQRPGDVVAFADSVPMWGSGIGRRVFLPGTNPASANRANTIEVSPDFFEAAGIRLTAGRAFTDTDLTATVSAPVVISETLARQLFGTTAAVGRPLLMDDARPQRQLHVAGIVGDVRWSKPSEAAPPLLFRPLLDPRFLSINNALIVRSSDPHAEVMRRVRTAAASIDPGLSITESGPLDDLVSARLGQERLFASVLTALAIIGFLLAAVGINGLVSQTVVERSREFGIRLAIGASRWSIVHGVLRSSLLIVLVGIPIGMAVGLVASQLTSARLFGVTPVDPAIHSMAIATLAAVVVLASAMPAWRAARTNPVDILRVE